MHLFALRSHRWQHRGRNPTLREAIERLAEHAQMTADVRLELVEKDVRLRVGLLEEQR